MADPSSVDEQWRQMCLSLALERQTGMPRWNCQPRYRIPIDHPEVIAARRQVLAEIEPDTRPRHLRRIA